MKYLRMALVSIAALALAGCSNSVTSKASTGTTTAKTTASTATTLPSTLVALQQWKVAEHENSRIGTLVTAVNAMHAAMGAANPGTTGTVCHAMSVAATQDLTTSTAPVAAVETHWRAMLYDFQAVAAVCLQAVTYGPDAQLTSSLSTDIGDATTQMRQLFAAGG